MGWILYQKKGYWCNNRKILSQEFRGDNGIVLMFDNCTVVI